MRKSITLLLVLIMPIMLFGQSYSSLWKQVDEAGDKDLPKTEYDILQKIVKNLMK